MSWRKQSGGDSYSAPHRGASVHEGRSSSAGRSPPRGGSGHSHGGGSSNRWAAVAAENEDDYHSSRPGFNSWAYEEDTEENLNDSQYLQSKTRAFQDESLNSTRRALARLQQTEQVGQSNLVKMANQSDQLNRVESKLDMAEHKLKVSDAKAEQLKSLSRFFMIPSFGGKKVKKREEALRKEQESSTAAEEERERKHSERMQRLEQARHYDVNGNMQRSYTTPHGLERDDTENEIDGNLDQISSGLSRLKMMGQAMNQELNSQDAQMKRLYDKTAYADERVQNTNAKLTRILKK